MSSWCQVCGSADMTTGADGTLFCQSCGAQNDNYIEEAFDNDEAHLFSARYVRENRVAATQNEERERSQIPAEILAGSQAFISQPAPGETSEPSPGNAVGTPYGTGSGAGPSQTTQPLGSQFGLASQIYQKQPPIDKEELSSSIRKSYVEGIQKILFLQCETLVKNFDVTPLICGIIGPIWLRYLASTRVFEKSWADEALEVAEDRERRRKSSARRVFKEYAVDPGVPDESVTSGALSGPKKPRRRRPRKRKGVVQPRTTYGRKARFVWLSALRERIPLSITLALTYLACYIARETILPTDIRRWALKGKLPFLAAFLELSKPSGNHIPNTVGGLQTFPMSARVMFKPLSVVGARAVELLAGHVAERIGLQLPPVNYHALSARLLHEMKLPVEKLSVYTHRIYEWYCPTGLWLTSKESALPTRVYVMALIVIVLKVLYKLDGRTENSTPEREEATNAATVEMSLHNRDSYGAADKDAPEGMQVDSEGPNNSDAAVTSQKQKNMDVEEEDPKVPSADGTSRKVNELEEVWDVKELLVHMKKMKPFRSESKTMVDQERKLAAYLKYCRDVIYPGPGSDADEEALRDHFWKIYEKMANEKTANRQQGESDYDIEVAVRRGEEEAEGRLGTNVDTEGRTDTRRYSTHTHGSVGSVAGMRNKVQLRKTSNDGHIRLESSRREEVNDEQDEAVEADLRQKSDSEMEDFDPTEADARCVQELELQKLMKEMKKVGFSCLPPMTDNDVPEDAYVRYRFQISEKSLRPVHAEYFIVLRVCAKLIKVHPKALHWGVQLVEQGLLELEKNTREFMMTQEGEIAKRYMENFGDRTVYRLRDRAGEFKRKKQKLMLARYRVDVGFGSETDYTDLILHADYL